jgi:hypothetical protein
VTTTTGVVTITVYPAPPPYKPTTVTVYACTTIPVPITPCAEATLFPNLIVPIKEATPDACYGTQYTGLVSSTTANNNIDSLFAFDVPYFYETQNPTCQLTFTLPAIGSGFPRTISGTGQVAGWIQQNGQVPCAAGSRVGIEMVPVGQSELEWFEAKTPLAGLTLEIFA